MRRTALWRRVPFSPWKSCANAGTDCRQGTWCHCQGKRKSTHNSKTAVSRCKFQQHIIVTRKRPESRSNENWFCRVLSKRMISFVFSAISSLLVSFYTIPTPVDRATVTRQWTFRHAWYFILGERRPCWKPSFFGTCDKGRQLNGYCSVAQIFSGKGFALVRLGTFFRAVTHAGDEFVVKMDSLEYHVDGTREYTFSCHIHDGQKIIDFDSRGLEAVSRKKGCKTKYILSLLNMYGSKSFAGGTA